MEFLELFENNVNNYTSKIKQSKYIENTNHSTVQKKGKKDICHIIISKNNLEYSLLKNNEKDNFILKKKLEIASEIDTSHSNDYYNFSFNKSLISNGLQSDNNFSSILYLNDIFKCNCIIHNKDTNKYYKTGLKNYENIICKYENNSWFLDDDPVEKIKTYSSDLNELNNIIHFDIKTNEIYKLFLKPFSNYKLDDLRKIAEELNIDLKKNNKKKIKKELYNEINLKKLLS